MTDDRARGDDAITGATKQTATATAVMRDATPTQPRPVVNSAAAMTTPMLNAPYAGTDTATSMPAAAAATPAPASMRHRPLALQATSTEIGNNPPRKAARKCGSRKVPRTRSQPSSPAPW